MARVLKMLKSLVVQPLWVLVALVVVIEETIWDVMKTAMAFVARLPPVRWYEGAISRLPPYAAFLALLLPLLTLLPVKIAALWLLARGHVLEGIAVICLAKVASTGFVARTFVLCRPQLMTIGWFARGYEWALAWRNRLYARVRAMAFYQALHRRVVAVKAFFREHRPRRAAAPRTP